MPEQLTLEELKRELGTALAASEKSIVNKIHDDNEPHFTAIQTDLGKITDRLDRIEQLLWQGSDWRKLNVVLLNLRSLLALPILRFRSVNPLVPK